MAGQLPRDVGEKTSWESTSQLADVLKKLNVQLGNVCWGMLACCLFSFGSLSDFDHLGKSWGKSYEILEIRGLHRKQNEAKFASTFGCSPQQRSLAGTQLLDIAGLWDGDQLHSFPANSIISIAASV